MSRKLFGFILFLLLLSGLVYRFRVEIQESLFPSAPSSRLVLYGNVDHRQLRLSFQLPERISTLLPEEGAHVRKGELLGQLETTRLQQDLDLSEARLQVSRAAVEIAEIAYRRAKNGSRSEDVAIARAAQSAIQARVKAAGLSFTRKDRLVKERAVAEQERDSSEADYLFYQGALAGVKSYLDRLLAGERPEDVDAAKATVDRAKAELVCAERMVAVQRQRLRDAALYAPCDGVIRNRLLEPGEMATPQSPVLTLSKISPKWIRCYLTETDLPRVRAGDLFDVHFDGAAEPFEGWVGFISENAEFTPKNIETPELRSSLVYEVRVYVKDPQNRLKLGAPCTLELKKR